MEILLLMVLAHLVGDYLLQWRRLAEDKEKGDLLALLMHALLYALAMNVVFRCVPWNRALIAWAVLSVSHGLIDLARVRVEQKRTAPRDRLIAFCVDQLLHLGLVVLCWALFLRGQRTEFLVWLSLRPWFRPALRYGLLLGVIWQPTAILVRRVLDLLPPPKERPEEPEPAHDPTAPAAAEPEEPTKAPEEKSFRSGAFIGKLERVIVAALTLSGAAWAAGLLLTAKSLACFKQMEDRSSAERWLVGTLLSVCVALIAALAVKKYL